MPCGRFGGGGGGHVPLLPPPLGSGTVLAAPLDICKAL